MPLSPLQAPAPRAAEGRKDALLRSATLELPPGSDPERLKSTRFAAGSDVYIAFLSGNDWRRSLAVAGAVRRAGFNPVPHLAAREMASREALDDFLARLAGEAEVKRLLVIGGDSPIVRGPYKACVDVMASGLLQRHGILRVDVAAYPEGSAYLTFEQALESLAAKLAEARRSGLTLGAVTQFCLDAAPIAQWLGAMDARGLDMPLRLGLAGPATLATLAKFALRCGVGNSLRSLRPHIGKFGRLLQDEGPDAVVDGLGDALGEPIAARVEGFHIYAFGGVRKANDWLKARLAAGF